MRVLLLGGTADGNQLAGVLGAAGHEVITSVAGRTTQARQAADRRVGGFGGAAGLSSYLRNNDIEAVVDATHPFAEQMTRNAAQACESCGVPLLRFNRPGWTQHPNHAEWSWVDDHRGAAQLVMSRFPAGRALLTVGRQPLSAYHGLPNVLARVAEWAGGAVPAGWCVRQQRGPFTLSGELALLLDEQISVLVSKDSGGAHTAAKLEAAHQLRVPVVMVRRPATPPGVAEVATHAGVVRWLEVQGFIPDPAPRPHR
ncbi:MAG: cobalt-precorrin-6A reductase [Brooklawnia sp.]|jgi:precorrin-6A/cobalt-precorrin-6A reductase